MSPGGKPEKIADTSPQSSQLDETGTLDSIIATYRRIDDQLVGGLTLQEARVMRKQVKSLNAQLSRAAELGGMCNKLLGRRIDTLQKQESTANPKPNLAEELRKVQSQLDELKTRRDQ